MVAFPYRLPAGFAGQVTRSEEATVESALINASSPPLFYGSAVVVDANGCRAVTSTDTAISGFIVRPFPTSEPNTTDGIGVATPNVNYPANVLKRGYMLAKIGGATAAAKGGAVWARVAGAGSGKVVGDVEAAVDGGTAAYTVALDAKSSFMGPADSTGIVEIAFNL